MFGLKADWSLEVFERYFTLGDYAGGEARWCPGCGDHSVLTAAQRLLVDEQLKPEETVFVSGIGCSSRISGYMDFHTLHTIHGRALAFATGVKLSKPELNVIVPMGDGDALSIGGNHFIHAARRNIDMTAIVMNNRIYGMTGGQYSPLTGPGMMATTAPYSNIDQGFDVVEMATAAGATFVARTTSYHVQQMADIIRAAILHEGFSVVEVMSQCPTYFGRKNKLGSAVDMMNRMKAITTPIGSKKKAENPELIERGIPGGREVVGPGQGGDPCSCGFGYTNRVVGGTGIEYEYVVQSDWYQQRLKIKQQRDAALWQMNRDYIEQKMDEINESVTDLWADLQGQLENAEHMLEWVNSDSYLERLQGTLGADWIHRGA